MSTRPVVAWQTGQVLLDEIRDAADGRVVLAPENPAAEFANTHWFTVTVDERLLVTVEQMVNALEETVLALRRQLDDADGRPTATFYVWFDEQAGQLRCSVSSRPASDLPFRGRYELVDDVGVIVRACLADSSPGVVAWDELEPVDDDSPDDGGDLRFPVWALDLSPAR
jgi:hypothetical protein